MNYPSSNPVLSIVTPSHNMHDYLKRCCASVSDQRCAHFEHIVVDAVSDDGTVRWLRENKHVHSIVEKDNGMYDAVNKGWEKAKGEILSYLNCDEQYLPGTLEFVHKYFKQHPEVDVLFGDLLLVRPDGTLISYRKGYRPRWFYILSSHLYVLSCTMFLRRQIIEAGFRFDARLKDIGDADLVVRLMRHGYCVRHVKRYLAAFTMTGQNMSVGENARRERAEALMKAPAWIKLLRIPLNMARRCEKFMSGAYFQKMPLKYELYVSASATRINFEVQKASFRWMAE